MLQNIIYYYNKMEIALIIFTVPTHIFYYTSTKVYHNN